jgi:hypothetical protein
MSDLISTFIQVQSSRYSIIDTRYSILETGYRNTDTEPGPEPKESRSRSSWESHGAGSWMQRSLDTKVELKSRVWGQGLLLASSKITFWRKISFVDGSLHHLPLPEKPGSVVNYVTSHGRTPQFVNHFSSLRTGNEVYFNIDNQTSLE